jgi:NADPH:quinone reductase-like Zn-dependent oxidoreductase
MSIPATMRALQQTSLNGPQDLRLITGAPVPMPGPGEILIRVTAAGVNFIDISQARGTFPGGPRPPYLAGLEAAGEIVAVGGAVGRAGTRCPRHRGGHRRRCLRRVHGAGRGRGGTGASGLG